MGGGDPRVEILKKRYSGKKNIFVISPKGGVGKTLISCSLAMALSKYKKVGLMDLDMTSPSCHLVLGVPPEVKLSEEKGLHPVKIGNLGFFSPVFFSKDIGMVLKGKYKTEAFLELLSIANWKGFEIIIYDTPPGMDEILVDILRYFQEKSFVIVTTESILSRMSVKRLLDVIGYENIIGIIENMSRDNVQGISKYFGVRFLGKVPFYPEIESYFGEKFHDSPIVRELENIALKFKKDFLE